jgi:endonuclease/exonuclease/phosphatase family metal-dependent hydrolase
MGEKLEIVGLNAGYFLGYDGRKQKYLRHPLRSLIGDREIEEERIENIAEEIRRLEPDIVGLVEIDQGSMRTLTMPGKGQAGYLVEKLKEESLEYSSCSELKYRDISPVKKIPLVASMSNGVLFQEGEIRKYHIHRGWKRLLLEVKHGDISVFVCHLPYPLFRRTQGRQLEEISEILDGKEKYVLYGDFNIEDHDRLDILREKNNAEIFSPGKTYPTCNPEKTFDIFVTGPGIRMKEHEILETEVSDHRPVRAKIEIKED